MFWKKWRNLHFISFLLIISVRLISRPVYPLEYDNPLQLIEDVFIGILVISQILFLIVSYKLSKLKKKEVKLDNEILRLENEILRLENELAQLIDLNKANKKL